MPENTDTKPLTFNCPAALYGRIEAEAKARNMSAEAFASELCLGPLMDQLAEMKHE
jgi:hypothetical protein